MEVVGESNMLKKKRKRCECKRSAKFCPVNISDIFQ